jgi:hypothetical protein
MICDKWGTSREELAMPRSPLFTWRSLLFARHSPRFAPFELGGMGREELFGRLEAGGMPHEGFFASLEAELAALSLAFGRLEGRGTRLEEQGTRREGILEGCKVLFREEEDGGMRLAARIAQRLVPTFFDR